MGKALNNFDSPEKCTYQTETKPVYRDLKRVKFLFSFYAERRNERARVDSRSHGLRGNSL